MDSRHAPNEQLAISASPAAPPPLPQGCCIPLTLHTLHLQRRQACAVPHDTQHILLLHSCRMGAQRQVGQPSQTPQVWQLVAVLSHPIQFQ
jgi:hypothetical protein